MSMTSVEKVVQQVKDEATAREVVAELLKAYSTNEAWQRLTSDAKYAKQTPAESVRRAVTNLFTSFRTYK